MVVMRGCASSAAFCTSACDTSTIFPSTPKSVMTDTPNTLMPQWLATITSGTVDIPTASAPKMWNIVIFRRSFERRTLRTEVHALLHLDAFS